MKTCPFCAEEIQDAAIVCKHCGKHLQTRTSQPLFSTQVGLVGKIGLVVIGAFVALAIVGSMLTSGSSPFSSGGVSRAQFLALNDGISYQETTQILGAAGTELSRSSIGGMTTVMYGWPGAGSIGANMNAMFQDDRLIQKAQFGLK